MKHIDELKTLLPIPNTNFVIGKYPVSQMLWKSVMGTNPSHFSDCDEHPVESVSWIDCILFCNKLSEIDGLEKAYLINGVQVECTFDCNGYRLPTSCEWSLASDEGNGHIYSGHNDPRVVSWYNKHSHGTSQPVGLKRSNKFGLFDMSGNIWEWMWDRDASHYSSQSYLTDITVADLRSLDSGQLTECNEWNTTTLSLLFEQSLHEDRYDYTSRRSEFHRHVPEKRERNYSWRSSRVIRGGSWADPKRLIKLPSYASSQSVIRCNTIGFRLCQTKRD